MNIFRELKKENSKAGEYMVRAEVIWSDIENRIKIDWAEPDITKRLAEEISHELNAFRDTCGNESLYREVMVISGIERYYDNRFGFQERIRKAQVTKNAILMSKADTKTKAIAEKIGALYNI